MRFSCPYLAGEVELREERERHIEERHPDLLPKFRDRIGSTVTDPDEMRRSSRSADASLFSRRFDDIMGGKHLVVVIVSELRSRRQWNITAYLVSCGMDAKLTFKYNRESDILHIDKCPPYPSQQSEELGNDVVTRLNPTTREVENLEEMYFSTRLLRTELFQLPVTADLRLTAP